MTGRVRWRGGKNWRGRWRWWWSRWMRNIFSLPTGPLHKPGCYWIRLIVVTHSFQSMCVSFTNNPTSEKNHLSFLRHVLLCCVLGGPLAYSKSFSSSTISISSRCVSLSSDLMLHPQHMPPNGAKPKTKMSNVCYTHPFFLHAFRFKFKFRCLCSITFFILCSALLPFFSFLRWPWYSTLLKNTVATPPLFSFILDWSFAKVTKQTLVVTNTCSHWTAFKECAQMDSIAFLFFFCFHILIRRHFAAEMKDNVNFPPFFPSIFGHRPPFSFL